MPDNLTITIGADTAKLRADLALAQAALRQFSRELKTAAEAARQTGQTEQLQAAAQRYQLAEQQARRLAQAIRGAAATANAARSSFRELGIEVGHFTHAAGIGIEGIRAIRFGLVGLGAAEVIRGMKGAIEAMNEFNNAAKKVVATTKEEQQTLKGLQTSAKNAGQEIDLAAQLQSGYFKVWDESRLKQIGAGGGVVDVLKGGRTAAASGLGVDVLRGNVKEATGTIQDLQTVLRGGQEAALNWADPLKTIGQTITKDRNKDMAEAAKRILAIKDATLQNLATQKAFGGLTFPEAEPHLRALATGTLPKTPVPTAQDQAQLKTYNEAVTAAAEKWDEINRKIALTSVLIGEAATHTSNWAKLLDAMASGKIAEIPALQPPPTTSGGDGQSASAPLPPRGGGQDFSGGMAAGGLVRGPGTATSDSILARLSAGEFVVNAGAVQRFGAGFLQGLNSYAAGGLVIPEPIRFAEGGLVAAPGLSGHAAAHFHFESGRSFQLSGPADVVGAMVGEAKAQQMRAAGVKPTWYAGRPGG